MSFKLAAAGRKAAADGVGAALDSGDIVIYTGAEPDEDAGATGTLLVTLTYSADAYAVATDDGTFATIAANAITQGTAVASGDAGYFRVRKSDATVIGQGSITATGGGGDLTISTISIATDGIVKATAGIDLKFPRSKADA